MDSLMLTLDLILIKNSISRSPKPQLFLALQDGAATRKLRPLLSAHSALSIFLSCLVLSFRGVLISFSGKGGFESWGSMCKIRLSRWAKLQPGLPSFVPAALLADSPTAQLTCGPRGHFCPPGALFLFSTFLGYGADSACGRVCVRRGWELYMGNHGCV